MYKNPYNREKKSLNLLILSYKFNLKKINKQYVGETAFFYPFYKKNYFIFILFS